MSRGACIVLGIFCLGAGITFRLLTTIDGFPPGRPNGKYGIIGLGVFCTIIGWACLFPRSRPVTLRIIGAGVFITCVEYVMSQWGDANILNAVIAFIVFGLPGGFVAVTGRYPTFGSHAAAFGANKTNDPKIRDRNTDR